MRQFGGYRLPLYGKSCAESRDPEAYLRKLFKPAFLVSLALSNLSVLSIAKQVIIPTDEELHRVVSSFDAAFLFLGHGSKSQYDNVDEALNAGFVGRIFWGIGSKYRQLRLENSKCALTRTEQEWALI